MFGDPVHLTSFASDLLNPVRESDVSRLFAAAGAPGLALAANVRSVMDLLQRNDAVLVDAGKDEHLEELMSLGLARRDVLWAGSTGLVRAAAQILPTPPAASLPSVKASKPLIVVGSMNPVSRLQASYAVKAGLQVLTSDDEPACPDEASFRLVARVLGRIGRRECDSLVVTGGETARGLTAALCATGIDVLGEVGAGMPIAILQFPGGKLPLVLKAGGFGGIEALADCAHALGKVQEVPWAGQFKSTNTEPS